MNLFKVCKKHGIKRKVSFEDFNYLMIKNRGTLFSEYSGLNAKMFGVNGFLDTQEDDKDEESVIDETKDAEALKDDGDLHEGIITEKPVETNEINGVVENNGEVSRVQ